MKSKNDMSRKVEEYITEQRKLGFKFLGGASMLRRFADYADTNMPGQALTISLALRWVDSNDQVCNLTKLGMLSAVRGFAKFLLLDDSRTQLIPKKIRFSCQKRKAPYIFPNSEIIKIINSEPDIRPTRFGSLTRRTIFGLMACTGMRIGEVLKLRLEDVNLDEGILSVLQVKKMPVRLIPIDETVRSQLLEYAKKRDRKHRCKRSKRFFLNEKGSGVSYASISSAWNTIIQKTKIGGRRKRQPRMHDLRHTFACNHLIRAYRENRNIDDAVYMLSVYLGHTDIAGTYWYLTAIPELLAVSAERFEKAVIQRRKGGVS